MRPKIDQAVSPFIVPWPETRNEILYGQAYRNKTNPHNMDHEGNTFHRPENAADVKLPHQADILKLQFFGINTGIRLE